MAKYQLKTKAYLGGQLLQPGSIILWSGIPGSYMEPLDEEAKAAFAKRLAEKPNFATNPVKALPLQFAELEVISEGKPAIRGGDIGNLARPGKPAPGLSEGGSVPSELVVEKEAPPPKK